MSSVCTINMYDVSCVYMVRTTARRLLFVLCITTLSIHWGLSLRYIHIYTCVCVHPSSPLWSNRFQLLSIKKYTYIHVCVCGWVYTYKWKDIKQNVTMITKANVLQNIIVPTVRGVCIRVGIQDKAWWDDIMLKFNSTYIIVYTIKILFVWPLRSLSQVILSHCDTFLFSFFFFFFNKTGNYFNSYTYIWCNDNT